MAHDVFRTGVHAHGPLKVLSDCVRACLRGCRSFRVCPTCNIGVSKQELECALCQQVRDVGGAVPPSLHARPAACVFVIRCLACVWRLPQWCHWECSQLPPRALEALQNAEDMLWRCVYCVENAQAHDQRVARQESARLRELHIELDGPDTADASSTASDGGDGESGDGDSRPSGGRRSAALKLEAAASRDSNSAETGKSPGSDAPAVPVRRSSRPHKVRQFAEYDSGDDSEEKPAAKAEASAGARKRPGKPALPDKSCPCVGCGMPEWNGVWSLPVHHALPRPPPPTGGNARCVTKLCWRTASSASHAKRCAAFPVCASPLLAT